MKKEDFNEIKDFCLKKGYEVSNYKEDTKLGVLLHVKQKDIWDGVEFASVDNQNEPIYKIVEKGFSTIKIISRGLVNDNTQGNIIENPKNHFKPSTESAYVEQLKKEAFEKYGEIKEGDRFERNFSGIMPFKFTIEESGSLNGFEYFKDYDALNFNRETIYQAGKWAKKLPKRVEVEYLKTEWNTTSNLIKCEFHVSNPKKITKDGFGFLAKQLEAYLNNEL